MEPVDWRTGTPRSARYGDVYHSESGALEQARHVFLGGCDLPAAWADASDWAVLETGFGLGLNFLATWRAWHDDPRRPQRLHYHAIERHPVAPAEYRRAAAREPDLAALGVRLSNACEAVSEDRLDDSAANPLRLAFVDGRVLLTLYVGDAAGIVPALAATRAPFIDSAFLDGFSPARNPVIWSEDVLRAVAALMRPGARLSTWCVAASVRRPLAAAGLIVNRLAGLPPKRHRLAARKPATVAVPPASVRPDTLPSRDDSDPQGNEMGR